MTCNKIKNYAVNGIANEETRVHETLAMQASQWKSHCEELTQQYEAQVAQDAERISEMERDLDDLSSKFIEASEKLEQWESWWNRGIFEGRPGGRIN